MLNDIVCLFLKFRVLNSFELYIFINGMKIHIMLKMEYFGGYAQKIDEI